MHEEGGQGIDESGELPSATSSQDVWSFGVVLLELCIGRSLFSQDTANDELVHEADRVSLCAWRTANEELLSQVFASSDAFSRDGPARLETIRVFARDLIGRCLVGESEQRPTLVDILKHPLFLATAQLDHLLLPPIPMLPYLYFISHAQGDAAGTAKALFNMLQQLGVDCWYDMNQGELTLQGMKRGVQDSSCFLLILTKTVLKRWFCRQESLEAIACG